MRNHDGRTPDIMPLQVIVTTKSLLANVTDKSLRSIVRHDSDELSTYNVHKSVGTNGRWSWDCHTQCDRHSGVVVFFQQRSQQDSCSK